MEENSIKLTCISKVLAKGSFEVAAILGFIVEPSIVPTGVLGAACIGHRRPSIAALCLNFGFNFRW